MLALQLEAVGMHLQLNPPERGLMLARGWRNTDQKKDVPFFVWQNKGRWLKE